MHLYLCIANENGDPLVEQVPEVGFHSEEVGVNICGTSEEFDNPNTAGKPRSIIRFLVFYKCYSHKSYVYCIK